MVKKTLNIICLPMWLLSTILIILPVFSPTVAGYWWWISLLALPLFFVNLISFFYWARTKSILTVPEGLILIFFIPILCPYIPSSFSNNEEKHSSQNELKIVSWNVNNFNLQPTSLQLVAKIIRSIRPDVICLQERPHNNLLSWESIQKQFKEYPYMVKNQREDEVLNLAILSKYPLVNVQTYYFPETFNKQMRTDVQIGQKYMRLFNVHLQTTGLGVGGRNQGANKRNIFSTLINNAIQRNMQAKFLSEKILESSFPLIVCGDFNDVRTSYVYRTIAEHLQSPQSLGLSFQATYPSKMPLFKIDYIFCSNPLKAYNYRTIRHTVSDHCMQVCSVRI